MPRYAIQLSYLGTSFHGWQMQHNAASVQEELTKAISTVLQHDVELMGCGRTDAGVHAQNFIAHFDAKVIPEQFVNRVNGILPDDIAVQALFGVADDFHSRFDALERSYRYRISKVKNPFARHLIYVDRRDYDLDLMKKACEIILNTNEFGAFCKLHSDNKTNVCNVTKAEWTQTDSELVFEVTADRFLRNMVRAMVGTMLDVGQKKISLDEFQTILDSQDRSAAGRSVPASGLMLTDVKYDRSNWISYNK